MAVNTTDILCNNDSLHNALNDSGYICSPDFTDKVFSAINTKPVSGAFLYGMAGTGKSYLPMILAEVLNRQLFVHQCTQGTREEDLLIKIMPSEDTASGVKIGHGKIYEAAIESQTRPVMLMLDEWDKTRPSVDGFFLDFLQYGRLSLPGVEGGDVQANLDNLTIFITANDEREFHEALLRRFPMIHVNPIPPADVVSALQLTHDGNLYIPQMIDLYTRSISANLPKPATIQELRQLLDAIDLLGNRADWDTLVYQYITKTPENHAMLSAQDKVEVLKEDKMQKIEADDYGVDAVPLVNKQGEPEMPDLRDLSQFDSSFNEAKVIPDGATIVINRTSSKTNNPSTQKAVQNRADNVVMSQNLDANDPVIASLPDWGSITKDYSFICEELTSVHTAYLDKLEVYSRVRGEIKIVDKYITRQELNRMLRNKWNIHKRDSKEIIARYKGSKHIDLRYREGHGLEVICDTSDKYKNLFRMNRKENLADNWRIDEFENHAALSELSHETSTHIAVGCLRGQVLEDDCSIGNSVLKSFSEHKGYCDIIYLQSPDGGSQCQLGHVPYFRDIVDMTTSGHRYKVKVSSIQDGFLITGNNIDFACHKLGDLSLGMMKLRIDGIPNFKLMGYLIHWLPYLPLYRCFQHDGNIRTELQKAGWVISRSNPNTLYNGKIYAHICYDYVLFCSFINSDYYDEDTFSLEMKQKINRIKALEKRYKSATD